MKNYRGRKKLKRWKLKNNFIHDFYNSKSPFHNPKFYGKTIILNFDSLEKKSYTEELRFILMVVN